MSDSVSASFSKESSNDQFMTEDDLTARFSVDFNDVFDFPGSHLALQAPGPLGCLGLVHTHSVLPKLGPAVPVVPKSDFTFIDRVKEKKPTVKLSEKKKKVETSQVGSSKSPVKDEMPGLRVATMDGKMHYYCESCPYNTATKKCIYRHVQSVHMGIKAFKCPHCQYTANYVNNIKRHVNSVHIGNKNWFCDECPYKTSDKGHLNAHIKAVHVKYKPFSCQLCKYRAFKQTDLNIHIAHVHEKVKNFECNVCNRKFSKKNNLNRHLDIVHNPNRTKKVTKKEKLKEKLGSKIIKENDLLCYKNKEALPESNVVIFRVSRNNNSKR